MHRIRVLDVTLRDGGCVNNFDFGEIYMNKILSALEESKVDIVELGYLDNKKGSKNGRTQFIDEQAITGCLLKNKKSNTTYVAMMDYGKFDPQNLQKRSINDIDGIRVAFHKKDIPGLAMICRSILDKGYDLFIQPMIVMRYTDREIIDLIDMINTDIPEVRGMYIVDSFGEMRMNDLHRLINIFDNNLNRDISLGFHSHNNLQLSYSNAINFIQFPTARDIIVDCSVMGMGKGAGNLNTELLLEHMNLYYNGNYNIVPLLEISDSVLNQIREEFYWGYSVEYYLSSKNHCTPSYAGYYFKKHMLPIEKVSELLSLIAEEKKISFDEKYAEELYREYNKGKRYDDSNAIQNLKEGLQGKTVLLVAPGKRIETQKQEIAHAKTISDITISLNMVDHIKSDYVFITRKEILKDLPGQNINVIVPSNVCDEIKENLMIIDYEKWIDFDGKTRDSSGVIAINLLIACGVKKILLAGFDGFSPQLNENYYKPELRRPVSEKQAEERNTYFSDFLRRKKEEISVEFVTDTLYLPKL
jgi:4-hydroxy 2-oxovalerate aldolase